LSSEASPVDPAMAGLPDHLAMIMDGNGRWARKRLFNRVRGHERGMEVVRTVVRTCRELEIPYLTLYAFSTENWARPQAEVSALMALLRKFLTGERAEMMDNQIRLSAIGEIDRLPAEVRRNLDETLTLTADNTGMVLNLALSYGSRAEIVQMARALARRAADGTLDPDAITTETVAGHLYTAGMPDPDLLIRTSGEMRISNFLLWQIAYAEIFITPTLWPDFTREELLDILDAFSRRERRFGKV
jgi:undecaprenyl diphosphate synthase